MPAASLLLAALLSAAPEGALRLPAPKTDVPGSLEAALQSRRSNRAPSDAPLTLAEAARLLWAAQGVTDAKGHRTAPSAHASYLLELYLVAGKVEGVAAGVYRYLPADHALQRLSSGDQRKALVEKAVGQSWIEGAPAVFVLTTSPEKAPAKLAGRAREFALFEAGAAAQNLLLEAAALGLGSTFVAGHDDAKARAVLGLPEKESVLVLLPVGRPKR